MHDTLGAAVADRAVDFSGAEKLIDTPVKFYASGMKVRLAFAVAAFERTVANVVSRSNGILNWGLVS